MLRWIKIEGFQLEKDLIEKFKIKFKPSLEETIHSGLDSHDLHIKRNALEIMEVNSVHDCSRKCLTMSACDMFEYNYDLKQCRMFPYLSLKDESWHHFAKSVSKDKSIFVLQCSTALEDLMVGNDFKPGTSQVGKWKFHADTTEAMQHEYVEESLDLLSSAQYFLRVSSNGIDNSQMGMETAITEADLPLGINNNFLTTFPQIALLRGNGFSFDQTNLDFTLKVNDKTEIVTNHIRGRFNSEIVPHMLFTDFTMEESLKVSLMTSSHTDGKNMGRVNLLINMPMNVGCFQVFFFNFEVFIIVLLFNN